MLSREPTDRQILYDGVKLRLELHHLQDDDGKIHRKELIVHPGAVAIIPLLPNDHILLIRNYRYAVQRTLVELPAGTIDKGESPMNCAGRELAEETGHIARKLQLIKTFYPTPGISTERMYLYIAHDLRPGQQHLTPEEDIELLPTSLADGLEMIRDGRIEDAKTIAGLMYYDRFHHGKG